MNAVLRAAGMLVALALAVLAVLFLLDLVPPELLLRDSLRIAAILGVLTAFVLIVVLLLRRNGST